MTPRRTRLHVALFVKLESGSDSNLCRVINMSIVDIWQQGNKILVDCLEGAIAGREPDPDKLRTFEFIKLELRKKLRKVEVEIEGFDAENWNPWPGPPYTTIGCSWDLESICRSVIQSKTKSVDFRYMLEQKAEYISFLLKAETIFESQKTTQKTTSTKKRGNRKMNTKAADCARLYRADRGQTPMNTIVQDYIDKNGGSFASIIRILNDNPHQWKNDKSDLS